MDDIELTRTAVHEASHAAASCLLRLRSPGPITIVPSGQYMGLCFVGSMPFPPRDRGKMGWPAPLLPASARAFAERYAIAMLAGYVGEELYSWALEGPPGTAAAAPERAVAAPERGARLMAALPPQEAAAIEAAAAAELPGDVANVLGALRAIHPDTSVVGPHYDYLVAETRALLSGNGAGKMIFRLARALLAEPVMPARRWRAILRGAS